MLILARRVGQQIEIDGGRIVLTVVEISMDPGARPRVRLGVECDKVIPVHRMEVARAIRSEAGDASR